MSKIEDKNALWVALNFIFPKVQERGEVYVKKSTKFKVFIDEELVGEVGKGDQQTFLSNVKINCKVDIVKGDIETGEVSSTFSWIVGKQYGKLYLSQDISKHVFMDFNNRNRVEVFDDRDWDFIDDKGKIINNQKNEESDSDNLE